MLMDFEDDTDFESVEIEYAGFSELSYRDCCGMDWSESITKSAVFFH